MPIDKLGSGCHQRLVGAPQKYKAQQGGSMATLWVGTNPASGHQPVPSHWTSLSEETLIPNPIATQWLDSYERWEGLGAGLAK